MSSPYYRSTVTCPYCLREFVASVYHHHKYCVCEPATYARIKAVMERADCPGYGITREVYDQIAVEHQAPTYPALANHLAVLGHSGGWVAVLGFFGLQYEDSEFVVAMRQVAAQQEAARQAEENERVGGWGLPVLRCRETAREWVYELR